MKIYSDYGGMIDESTGQRCDIQGEFYSKEDVEGLLESINNTVNGELSRAQAMIKEQQKDPMGVSAGWWGVEAATKRILESIKAFSN